MTQLSDAALGKLRDAVADSPPADSRYTLLEVLGAGGMGTVYRALDELLGREVAVKVLRTPVGPGSAALADRLRGEARVLARLEHAGIVPVHDAGVLADGRAFYAMKLVRGRTLADELQHVPELDRRVSILERVAEAVAFAHQRGVVHRDLKPANIMVGDFGEVLVMDWGVAKVVGEVERRAGETPGETPGVAPGVDGDGNTAEGTVVGTPGFMAPEQAKSGTVDRRSDVYSLGVLLVFLATGSLPSSTMSAKALLAEAKAVPGRIRAVATKCLASDPSARYQDAAELLEEIRRYRMGGTVLAYNEGWMERVTRWVSAYRTPILLILAYLIMRAVVAFVGR